MNSEPLLKELAHHAYGIIGGQAAHDELLTTLEKRHKVRTHGNADFFDKAYESFTIDDARELKALADTKPVTASGWRIFVVMLDSITVEAQNALLKLLEEPAAYVRFFLIVPSSHMLLPTVKSRLAMIDAGAAQTTDDDELVQKFIHASPAARLEIVKSFMDDISKEKRSKQEAVEFLNTVQSVLYKEIGVKKGMSALSALEVARKYMGDRAPSLKMLFEFAALNI